MSDTDETLSAYYEALDAAASAVRLEQSKRIQHALDGHGLPPVTEDQWHMAVRLATLAGLAMRYQRAKEGQCRATPASDPQT